MTASEAILTVGVWQDSGVLGDVAANMTTISRATAQAAQRGVDLLVFLECFLTGVNGSGIMLHAERPVGPVAAAQKCVTHGPLSDWARGEGCTAWSFMRRFDWRLPRRV